MVLLGALVEPLLYFSPNGLDGGCVSGIQMEHRPNLRKGRGWTEKVSPNKGVGVSSPVDIIVDPLPK